MSVPCVARGEIHTPRLFPIARQGHDTPAFRVLNRSTMQNMHAFNASDLCKQHVFGGPNGGTWLAEAQVSILKDSFAQWSLCYLLDVPTRSFVAHATCGRRMRHAEQQQQPVGKEPAHRTTWRWKKRQRK
jgi:hypothetical protein